MGGGLGQNQDKHSPGKVWLCLLALLSRDANVKLLMGKQSEARKMQYLNMCLHLWELLCNCMTWNCDSVYYVS